MVGHGREHSESFARVRALSSKRWRRGVPRARADGKSRVGRWLLRHGGQGFSIRIHFLVATGRMAVMKARARRGRPRPAISEARKSGKHWLTRTEIVDEMHCGLRAPISMHGTRPHADSSTAIVHPEDTRETLAMALRASLRNPGPHIGAFVLPELSPPSSLKSLT